MTRIAVLQMTSGIDPEVNFAAIRENAIAASADGAKILFTPEMSLLLDRDRQRASPHVEEAESKFVPRFVDLAVETGLHLAIGSMAVALPNGKWANRSCLFDPNDRSRSAYYDKIHMFDVDLDTGESWRESNAYEAGDAVVTVDDTPVGRLGLTVCYDLRFPALFEALGNRRCDVIAIPAAFTVPTGRAHWEIMIRARAIEASAYVVAAAQVGHHADGRDTYGHSFVVDPWGEILLDLGGGRSGLGFAEIDAARIQEVRAQVPSLANRRRIAN